jgi:type I restriction enzyme S subunit
METTTLLLDMKESDKTILLDILDRLVPAGLEVWAFGSRARWTARETSDLDLVLRNPAQLETRLETGLLDDLKEAFEESDLPFMVDLLDWATVSEKFRKVIERDYVVVRKSGCVGVRDGWETVKLQDCCIKIGSGATPRGGKEAYFEEGPFALIRSQNILDFFFSYNGLAFIDKAQADQLSNVEIKENDVLLNITGDSVARVCQVPNSLLPARVNQHVSIIRPDESKLTPEFLKYYLLNPKFKNHMLGLASVGGTRNALTKGMIEDFEIDLPPIEIQRSIAAILSAMDQKIELNRQTNQTLEAIAQTLFKEWFVDFNFPGATGKMQESELGPIPVGWRVGKIKNLTSKIQYGLTQSASTEEVGPRFLRITDIQNGVIDWSTVPFCVVNDKENEKYEIEAYDVFVARTGASTGESALVVNPPKAVFASYLIRLQFGKPELALYVAKFMRTNKYSEFIDGIKSGSAQPNANAQELTDPEIIIPPDELLASYFQIVAEFEKLKSENQFQNASVTQTRDTLLPKLMSGEIVPVLDPKGFENL